MNTPKFDYIPITVSEFAERSSARISL